MSVDTGDVSVGSQTICCLHLELLGTQDLRRSWLLGILSQDIRSIFQLTSSGDNVELERSRMMLHKHGTVKDIDCKAENDLRSKGAPQ